jgi:hypothetical protein
MKILKERWLMNAKPKHIENKRKKLKAQKKKILEIVSWMKSNGLFSYELFKMWNVAHINIKLIDNATDYIFDSRTSRNVSKEYVRKWWVKSYSEKLNSEISHLRYSGSWWEFFGAKRWDGLDNEEICDKLKQELIKEANEEK